MRITMKEQLISFETAKLAKEKGFKISTEMSYSERKEHFIEDVRNHGDDIKIEALDARLVNHKSITEERFYGRCKHEHFVCYAPTQSLLQKWLREEHNIYVDIHSTSLTPAMNDGSFNFIVVSFKDPKPHTYEEELEKGLQKALKYLP